MALWNVKRTVETPSAAPPPEPGSPALNGAAMNGAASADPARSAAAEAKEQRIKDRNLDLKVSIHRSLLDKINLAALEQHSREQIEAEIKLIVGELLEEKKEMLNANERSKLVVEVLDELLGLGPLEPLLKDNSITDILVNGCNQVFVERKGLLELVSRFQDDKHLLRIIQKVVSAVGRRIDESSPYVDARLADGSRVNAIIPPLAVDGCMLSIRKFARERIGMDRLIAFGSVPPSMAEVMKAIVGSRRNVLISGGTGSGKTTLLNALSSFIDNRERVVTIEDSPNCNCSRNMSSGSKPARPISKAAARCRSATWSRTRCACGPTGSSSAKCAPARPSTCSRR